MNDQRGQATVEVALALPLVAMLLGLIVEIGIVAADRSRVWNAAREGARVAAVSADPDVVTAAVRQAGLETAEVTIRPPANERVQGEAVTVRVSFGHEGSVPLVGNIFEGVVIDSEATMRIERP